MPPFNPLGVYKVPAIRSDRREDGEIADLDAYLRVKWSVA